MRRSIFYLFTETETRGNDVLTISIQASNLSGGYKGSFQLRDLTFSIEQGGFWGVIGPNGSGKSTLLKVLSKVLPIKNGKVTIDDRPLEQLSLQELARNMAVVGSEAHFTFPFRVSDVVLMGRIPFLTRLGAYGSRDRTIAENALKRTEVWEFRDRLIHQLSSGERQRVLLARALAQEPKILLLDEPTAHLDLHYEIEIFRILKNLNVKDNLTVLAVSHNLNLMAEFCSTLIVLRDGTCRALGAPSEILAPELLKDVFRIDCQVTRNPFSHAPAILLNTQ
jgi:cobalamin transport system ATP-binding protein